MTEIDYGADVALTAPTEERLARVVELARHQQVLERELKELEAAFEAKKKELEVVAKKELVVAMTEAGLLEYALLDGSRVAVKTQRYGAINEANRPTAHAWLVENGHEALIKHVIAASFGRGEDELARRVLAAVRELAPQVPVTDQERVHPQTLNAFVREMAERDVVLPPEINVMIETEAVITPPKKARSRSRDAL